MTKTWVLSRTRRFTRRCRIWWLTRTRPFFDPTSRRTAGRGSDRIVPALRQRLGGPAPSAAEHRPSTRSGISSTALWPDSSRGRQCGHRATADAGPFDDLHWADKPTLQLLRHVVSRTATHRLLIVGTYRNAELSSAHPLEETLAALHREPPESSVS